MRTLNLILAWMAIGALIYRLRKFTFRDIDEGWVNFWEDGLSLLEAGMQWLSSTWTLSYTIIFWAIEMILWPVSLALRPWVMRKAIRLDAANRSTNPNLINPEYFS